jgi:adenylyltransferase/sulfurtransferase
MYLAAGGIGTLGIIDSHHLAHGDLREQVLHTVASLGKNRAESAAKVVESINPDVSAKAYPIRLGAENISDVLREYDAVLECSGNSRTRYLLNDACYFEKKPLFIAEMTRDGGKAMSVYPGEGPCYRCAFPEPELDDNGSEGNGYSDAMGGLMGLIQAAEIFKFFLGKGDLLKGKLILWNRFHMKFQQNPVDRDGACPLCGEHPTVTLLMRDGDSYG